MNFTVSGFPSFSRTPPAPAFHPASSRKPIGFGEVVRIAIRVPGGVEGGPGGDGSGRRGEGALIGTFHRGRGVRRIGERLTDLQFVERRLAAVEGDVVADPGVDELLDFDLRVRLRGAEVLRRNVEDCLRLSALEEPASGPRGRSGSAR